MDKTRETSGIVNYISNTIKSSYSFIMLYCIVGFICYQIYLAYINTDEKNIPIYSFLIILPIIGLFIYITYKYVFTKQEFMLFMTTIGVVFIALLVILVMMQTNLSKYIFNKYILFSVIGLISLFGLTIIYTLFSSRIRKTTGWSGFFINLLFYIPCIISDFIKYLINDFNQTPRTLFILFIIEILLVIFYIYLTPVIHKKINENAMVLLKDPIFLSTAIRIDTKIGDFNKEDKIPITDVLLVDGVEITQNIRSTFSISLWIYINAMSSSKMGYGKETNIFNYAQHPQITYYNNNNNENTYTIYISKNDKYTIALSYQKWNNLVFNYNGNNVDIFLNGELNRTIPFTNELPVFSNSDIMVVGTDNGKLNNDAIYGSICNVTFYKIPLTKNAIISNYNLLVTKNPPIL